MIEVVREYERLATEGDCVAISKMMEEIFPEVRGFSLPINVDGVIGAIVADLGLDPVAARTHANRSAPPPAPSPPPWPQAANARQDMHASTKQSLHMISPRCPAGSRGRIQCRFVKPSIFDGAGSSGEDRQGVDGDDTGLSAGGG